jgi:hypothetical protein
MVLVYGSEEVQIYYLYYITNKSRIKLYFISKF